MIEAPRGGRVRDPGRPTLGDWAKEVAERALDRAARQPAWGRRGNREKELFALRGEHGRRLFRVLGTLAAAVNMEARSTLIAVEKTLNPKNLGGIEVPDGARFVLKFLERRLEVVVSPLVNIGGRPAPVGALATASVIQYDPADPSGADWFDVTLHEDGSWVRKSSDGDATLPEFGEREPRRLIEWLVGQEADPRYHSGRERTGKCTVRWPARAACRGRPSPVDRRDTRAT